MTVALSIAIVGAALLATKQLYGQSPGVVYVPLVPSYESVATPVPSIAEGERVYGLLGRLEAAQMRRYSYYLMTADGGRYGLVGETPEIERQLGALADGAPPVMVKVWGVLSTQANAAREPMIVVSGILSADVPAGVGAAAEPVAIVKFNRVNLYAEPRESSATVGAVTLRQACDITGRNPASTWYLLACADGQRGWIDARLVEVQGSAASVPAVAVAPPVPAATPTPLPPATPTVRTFLGWRMEMYDNPTLSGEPVGVADVPAIDFNWGNQAPDPALPVDGFSLRLERRVNFPAGFYRFTVQADDGVRVWLDDQLLVDEWHGASNQVYAAGRYLAGEHELRVEYYEASGLASLQVRYALSADGPVWEAAYYRGTALAGEPVLRQQELQIGNPLDYNWGASSPLPDQLGNDQWSARWTGTFRFDDGNYVFQAVADDGVRVWLDGMLVIDQWVDGYKEVTNRFLGVGQGEHTVRVEYYERSGLATLRLWWYKEAGPYGPR